MVGVSFQHLLGKLFRSAACLPPAQQSPWVRAVYGHQGVPGLVDGQGWVLGGANLKVLPPTSWDPGLTWITSLDLSFLVCEVG